MGSTTAHTEHQQDSWDAIEQYFTCISECSLLDGQCVIRCADVLREAEGHGESEESLLATEV